MNFTATLHRGYYSPVTHSDTRKVKPSPSPDLQTDPLQRKCTLEYIHSETLKALMSGSETAVEHKSLANNQMRVMQFIHSGTNRRQDKWQQMPGS